MSECAQIVTVLKRSLKARGMTYRELARRVQLSEASIKRIFAAESFTLPRLEEICDVLGLSIAEVVRMASQQPPAGDQQLTLAQEELLASDPRLLTSFYLIQNGREPLKIAEELHLSQRDLRALLVKLDAAKLIELLPKMKVRLRTSTAISWRTGGPVRTLYERQVKNEFLRAEFTGKDEALLFRSAELSEASAKILARKMEVLGRDFVELMALDAGFRDGPKRSMGLLLAMRPWVFSMYDVLRRGNK